MSKERNYMPVAVHLFLVKNGKILLLRRHNTGYEDGNFSVVAGHVDRGESLIQAAIREGKEEAGILINENDIKFVGVMHRKTNDERIDFFLVIKEWQGDITNCEPDKCSELCWVELNSLPSNTIKYIKRAIENWHLGKWFDVYGW